MEGSKLVGIIGTGDFGRALANRLLRCGYDVIMASRNPDLSRLISINPSLASVEVKTTKELLEDRNVEIVFLAIHSWNFESCLTPFKTQIQQKIFIDISNRERPSKTESNPERLVEAFPGLRVVKAFNTLSAYALESDTFGGVKQVLIASDDSTAREKISTLAREMGFTPIDYGVLRAARDLEAYPLTLMYGWGWPTLFCLCIFIGWNIVLCIAYVKFYMRSSHKFKWDHVPLAYVNKAVCLTAITLLALSYLPGCLAAFLQIINGANERLQQELEYTLLKPDCQSWGISKMQSGREDTLEERYAIKFCLKTWLKCHRNVWNASDCFWSTLHEYKHHFF